MNCASASSRPSTRTCNGPSSSSASIRVEPRGWRRGQLDIVRGHPELLERGTDLRARRTAAGRAEREVHRGADAPAEHHRGKRGVGQREAQIERSDRHEQDEQPSEPARRPGEERGRRRDHRHHHRHRCDRERRRRVLDAGDDVQALAEAVVLDDERTDEPAEEPRDEAGNGEVAGEAPATGDERGGDDDTDRPERAHREDRFEERLQIVGQTVDELDEVDLAVGGVSLVEAEPHHDPDRDDEAEPVTRAPSVRFLRRRPERAGPQALDREPGLGGSVRLGNVGVGCHGREYRTVRQRRSVNRPT